MLKFFESKIVDIEMLAENYVEEDGTILARYLLNSENGNGSRL